MKLKNCMTEESGDQVVRRLIVDEDFAKILKGKAVWDRLYDDALKRIEVMKKACNKFREKVGMDPLDGINFLQALAGSDLILETTQITSPTHRQDRGPRPRQSAGCIRAPPPAPFVKPTPSVPPKAVIGEIVGDAII